MTAQISRHSQPGSHNFVPAKLDSLNIRMPQYFYSKYLSLLPDKAFHTCVNVTLTFSLDSLFKLICVLVFVHLNLKLSHQQSIHQSLICLYFYRFPTSQNTANDLSVEIAMWCIKFYFLFCETFIYVYTRLLKVDYN